MALVKAGYRVFAGVRSQEAAAVWEEGYPRDRLVPVVLDVTSGEQVRAAAARAEEITGPGRGLHALVNNAGTVLCAPLETCPLDRIRHEFEVNLVAQLAVTQAFLPLVRKERGRILFTGSASGRFSPPFLGAYAGSKHGLEAMADALRRELAEAGIRVVMIECGAVETAVWDKALVESSGGAGERLFGGPDGFYEPARRAVGTLSAGLRRRAAGAEEVARQMVAIIGDERPKARYLLGVDARVQAALERWLPARWCDLLVKKVLELGGFRLNRP